MSVSIALTVNGKTVSATVDRTWAALNDPEVLKACIAGCESLERSGDDSRTAQLAVRVGPKWRWSS